MNPLNRIRGLVVVALATAGGCATASTASDKGLATSSRLRDVSAQGRHQYENFAHYERKLAQYRSERVQLAAAARDAAQCEELFALAQSICEVKEKLCQIADVHKAAPQYAELCHEAKQECQEAVTSCEACVSDPPAQ